MSTEAVSPAIAILRSLTGPDKALYDADRAANNALYDAEQAFAIAKKKLSAAKRAARVASAAFDACPGGQLFSAAIRAKYAADRPDRDVPPLPSQSVTPGGVSSPVTHAA